MATEIKMPQMGESIYESTITKWLKKEGDVIKKDEPLYEISTDKVDTEITAPVGGKLVKILHPAGSKVPIFTVIAQIEESGAAAPPAKPKAAPASKAAAAPAPKAAPPKPTPAPSFAPRGGATEGKPAPAPSFAPSGSGATEGKPVAAHGSADDDDSAFASPLVKKIAREENIDLRQVKGTGIQGRITKEDILRMLEERGGGVATAAAPRPVSAPAPAPAARPAPAPAATVKFPPGANTSVVPMSPKRIKIAEHMVMSRRTSAHVTTVFEVDLSKVVALREREKDDFERVYSTKLTYTPFFAMAAVQVIKEFPIFNSSVDGTNIVFKRDINVGIAVAQTDGLVVPVVKNAEEKSFLGICRAINDLAERSRTKKLAIDDLQGGTFTITNPGVYGGLFGTPIISQPQVAIMGIGGIEKRPVVVNDAIAIRSMCYLVLSFDHRVIDGADADQFMARVKQVLQEWTIPIK